MPKFSDFSFLSTNGKTKIYVRRFDPEGDPRGVIQIAHGVSEHCERYDAFAAFLAENGFVVVANDHLGHGRSVNGEDERGWFADEGGWDLVVGDMHKLHDTMAAEFPYAPYFLFGHSMGSFLARTYVIRYSGELGGAIICGTGQQAAAMVKSGKLLAATLKKTRGSKYKSPMVNKIAFGSYNKEFEPRRTDYDWLTRNTEVVDRYIKDPNCSGMASVGLFYDMMSGIEYIGRAENVAKVRKDLPILMISGDKDPVGEDGKGPKAALKLYKDAGIKDVSLKLYQECRHELLNELNRDKVMGDILSWINARMD